MYITDMVEELSGSNKYCALCRRCQNIFRDRIILWPPATRLIETRGLEQLMEIKFNSNKCKILRMSRVLKHDSVYRMNDEILENVTSFNDLRVLITKDLDLASSHSQKVSRANSVFAFIKWTYGYTASLKSKRTVCLALIRSSLLYCSAVWHPKQKLQKAYSGHPA